MSNYSSGSYVVCARVCGLYFRYMVIACIWCRERIPVKRYWLSVSKLGDISDVKKCLCKLTEHTLPSHIRINANDYDPQ